MSGKHLNDISKVYLDTIANVKKAETDADIKRWEDLGGPTPGNYRADDNSAKLKEGRRLRKSDWRQDLKEVIDKPETEDQAEKEVTEKKVKNKVVINPSFKEAIEEIGGELLEVNEVDSVEKTQDDTQKRQEAHKKQIEAKQKKVAAMKKIVLQKKMQAVRGGAGSDITAGYEPEGEMVEDYETKKTGEVLAAFKKDPKVRKRFEKAAKKEDGPGSVKNRAADSMLQTAKDTAKRKGDTSKSDDRYAYEEVVLEKDLNAAERRALPNKDFVFPGKGEGPEGKQRGAYPINDKKHARNALAMAAAHASPEKEAKVKAAVKKKYPEIEVSEAAKTVGTVVKQLGRIAAKKLQSKKVRKAIYKTVKKIGGAGVEGAVDAATDRAREEGGRIVRDAGKKKVDEAVVTGSALATAAILGATGAGAEHVTKKVLEKGDKKKEKKKVDEGVLQMVKSLGKKKTIRKPKMDSTTDKIHKWRKEKEKAERRKYVSDFDPIDEGKGYQPEIEHSKLGDAKKKADKKRESKLPPHLQGDAIGKMKKAFASEDKAFNFVVNKLKAQHGDGVLTKGDKMPQPSAAQKKKNAEIMAKRAKEDGRDATEKASSGRYNDRSRSD